MIRFCHSMILGLSLVLVTMIVSAHPVIIGCNANSVSSIIMMHKSADSSKVLHSPLAIDLQLAGEGTSFAVLTWTGGTTGDIFTVQRSEDINFTTPEVLGTTSLKQFTDTLIYPYCDLTRLFYRIITATEQSNVADGLFFDDFPPDDPVLSLVTINNGFAELTWRPSASNDVTNYSIEREQAGGQIYDYHEVGNDTFFQDNLTGNPDYINPCNEVVIYMVIAKDQCENKSPGNISYLNAHNTIFLTGNTSLLCERKATLDWNQYKSMDPPVTHYLVERSINGQPFAEIADIPSSGNNDYHFVDPDLLEADVPVNYRIAAVNSDHSGLSHSCERSLLPNPDLPDNFVIDYVTVTDNVFITLSLSGAPPASINKVKILRSESGGTLDSLTTVEWNTSGILTISDPSTTVDQTSYTYQALALDECEFAIAVTKLYNSILLNIFVSDADQATLYWNSHQGWDTEFQQYLLYKYKDGVVESGYPKVLSTAITEYTETTIADNSLNVTYAIEAIRADGTVSRSNEVVLPREPKIDVPNAFRPDGITPVFRPILKNIDDDTFLFVIYNRWGQKIFETNNSLQGWDGTINGNEAAQAIYIYRISYNDQQGTTYYKTGSIMLFR